MGTITERQSANGIRYRAEVRIKRAGKIVHREGKTFRTRRLANTWILKREADLEGRDNFTRYSIEEAVDEYIEKYQRIQNWGRSKDAVLKQIRKRMGSWDCELVTVGQLVGHITTRRSEGVIGSTAANDLIWLQVVFKAMRALGRPVNLQAVEDALLTCRQQNLISRPRVRDRRPTPDELVRLADRFNQRDGSTYPMADIMWFAIHSARRQAEITRLRWDDNDPDTLTGMVRDLKHPTKKVGNHKRFKYTQEAWDIVMRQPHTSEFIFPFDAKTVGTYFTKACKILEIEGLRFHDLRHEATSRLFETGYSITEVMLFTLHEDWSTLRRYTNLRPENVTLR